MQYEPIKNSINKVFAKSVFMRKTLYLLLDILLLRAWHVKRALRNISAEFPGDAAILDAGSGLGQYTWTLSKLNPLWTIKAVDINAEQLNDSRKFFSKVGLSERVFFETCDLTALAERGRYDLVLSVDVMEHIEKDLLVFQNFHRAMKENGILLISTPSDKGGSDVHGESETSFIDEHVRDGYGKDDISEKLTLAGFRHVDVKYTYGKPGSISWKLSMKYPIKMLNVSYIFFLVLPFYYIIFFPVSLILNFIDLHLTHKSGTGLLVTARK